MEIMPSLKEEYDQETSITKTFLEQVPEEKFDWKPHEKNMSMKDLAVHLAKLHSWVELAFNSDELDLTANTSEQKPVNSSEDLQAAFKEIRKKGADALNEASENDLQSEWTLRKGDQKLATWTKYKVVQQTLNHAIHHRAQLGLYFRLLDIPVPATYFRSADDTAY